MNATNDSGLAKEEGENKIPVIALRIGDKRLYERIKKLSEEKNMSINVVVNMLIGFAFNEVDKQNKTFVPKIVFESE